MSLLLLQVRTTYSSPSTPFSGNLFSFNYAHYSTEFHGCAEKNYAYALIITHLMGDVKKI